MESVGELWLSVVSGGEVWLSVVSGGEFWLSMVSGGEQTDRIFFAASGQDFCENFAS